PPAGSMLLEARAAKPPPPPAPPPPPSPASSGGAAPPPRTPSASDPERAASLSSQILDARYQVLKKLGEGGMSYVYLARELSSGQEAPSTVLPPHLATGRAS